jgi:hypothetical protein
VLLAVFASSNFASAFQSFLLLVLYFFIPWTAVSLTDYFIVPQGLSRSREIFKPSGIYGRWGWAGIASPHCLRVHDPVLQHRSVLHGFAATAMGGVDISLFSPIGAILYWVFTRNLDVAGEKRLADQQAAELENTAPEADDFAGAG